MAAGGFVTPPEKGGRNATHGRCRAAAQKDARRYAAQRRGRAQEAGHLAIATVLIEKARRVAARSAVEVLVQRRSASNVAVTSRLSPCRLFV